ncbi:MAG: hypothetical protein ABI352_05195 [Candidatus Dormibacter sp.]
MTDDSAAARHALARLAEAIDTHLRHEEADVLPLMPEAFTLDDYAFFQAESARTNPARAFLPWVLDGAPEADIAFFTGRMPASVREELESRWIPRRRSAVDALKVRHPEAAALPATRSPFRREVRRRRRCHLSLEGTGAASMGWTTGLDDEVHLPDAVRLGRSVAGDDAGASTDCAAVGSADK